MTDLISEQYLREVLVRRDGIEDPEAYPYSVPALRGLRSLALHPAVTFLVGENGTGKSTLLEAIAVAWGFNAEGGSRSFDFTTRSSHSRLHEALRLVRGARRPRDGYFFRAESYFNVATRIETLDEEAEASGAKELPPPILDAYGGRSLHEQSHGESFLALVLSRFHGHGLYLLDEPEAALSPTRQLSVLARIHELVRMKSQLVIATHSPILMAYPDSTLYVLGEDGIRESSYRETDYYTVTKRFLECPERMLSILLADDDAASGKEPC